jgi:preprotein translocase subunit YajC
VGSLIIIVALFALLWLLLIRPQRKRQTEQQRMLSSIELGDEVLTVGGLYGIVREVDEEDDLIVEIAEGIQVRIARRAVGGVVKPENEPADGGGTGDEAAAAADAAPEEILAEDVAVEEIDDAAAVAAETDVVAEVAEEGGAAAANEVPVVNGEESVSEGEARQA